MLRHTSQALSTWFTRFDVVPLSHRPTAGFLAGLQESSSSDNFIDVHCEHGFRFISTVPAEMQYRSLELERCIKRVNFLGSPWVGKDEI